MNYEGKIIQALYENSAIKNTTVAEASSEEDFIIDEQIYECPDCGEYFSSSIELISCVCPDCGEVIEPTFLGDVEDVTVDESVELSEAAVVKVKDGKVVKLTKKPRPGFKLVNGKYVKMSSKEISARRKAIKKAQRKSQSAGAKLARKKSMKVRKSRVNESTFLRLFNKGANEVVGTVKDTHYVPVVEEVLSTKLVGNDLVIECLVGYQEDDVKVVEHITVRDIESGSSLIESNLIEFDGEMIIESTDTDGEFQFTGLSYDYEVGRSSRKLR